MRRTIALLATMALTLLMASGLALAAGVGSAADSSVVGAGESIQKAINAADPGDTQRTNPSPVFCRIGCR